MRALLRRARAAADTPGEEAEGVGFEPTRSCELLAVFKTAAIGH